MKISRKIALIIIGIFFAISVWTINYYFINYQSRNVVLSEEKDTQDGSFEEVVVKGSSLSPLVESGQTVRVFRDYYSQRSIQRDDIVLIDYAGNEEPLIKIIKGLPGDKFSLKEADEENNWNVLINGEVLKNSEGEDYMIGYGGHRMLSLYEKDYNGVIPENTYLVLGNIATGSLDSTRFGLIDKANIIAKAEL